MGKRTVVVVGVEEEEAAEVEEEVVGVEGIDQKPK
jgi:hypothetical protein